MFAQLWNSNWKFWEEKNAFALVWDVPENAREITLPHDAMLENKPHPDCVNGGDTGYRDGGNYVYVKQFKAPEDYRDMVIALRFEGIYMNSLVYLNGQLVGKRPYGYSGFTVYLNDYLRYGETNELRVLVKNSGMPNSRWYSGSGIYRDVYLLTGAPTHIPYAGVKVSTEYVENNYAALTVGTKLVNRDFRSRSVKLTTEIYDCVGELAAATEMPITLLGSGEESIEQNITVNNPHLWSAEEPNLYRCVVRISGENGDADEEECTFGIRSLRLDAQRGLQVNGEAVKLRGACIHHDNGILGSVSIDKAEMRRVRILKEAGFNAIRMAHNPASPALLRACDKLGMYVMDEAFDMWSRPKKDNDYALFMDKWWREDVEAMVENDYNHPSVIFYSLGNEIPEVGTAQGSALGREMARFVKSLDKNRFVLVSINGVFAAGDYVGRIMADVLSAAAARGEDSGNVNDFMAAMDAHMDDIVVHPLVSERIDTAAVGMDLVGYNYMAARYEPDAKQYPHRVVVGSETYPPHIARNWALVNKLPNVVGDFTWTGWDYIGEAGVGIPAYHFGEGGFGAQYPCQLAYCGDIDITGFRRPASYLREIVFGLRKNPYITVQDPAHFGEQLMKTPWVISDSLSSWSWNGFENKPIVVEVYSPGSEVELFVNGVSLGRKPAGENAGFITEFEASYQPGEIVAVAYDDGEELGRMQLHTVGECEHISIRPEETDCELIYIELTLCDKNGDVAVNCDMQLSVEVASGVLVGLGSGNPKPVHNYKDSVVNTFHGRALAIVRKTSENTTITVSAENGIRDSLSF